MKNNLNQTAHVANRDGYAFAAQMNRELCAVLTTPSNILVYDVEVEERTGIPRCDYIRSQ